MIKVLASTTVVTLWQYVNESNQHILQLKLYNVICQLYLHKKGKIYFEQLFKKVILDLFRHRNNDNMNGYG